MLIARTVHIAPSRVDSEGGGERLCKPITWARDEKEEAEQEGLMWEVRTEGMR